jgi:menaquinone-dependent protoporphyrinogen oxidase
VKLAVKILVLYATTEGQTRKIADFAAKQFEGDEVTLVDAVDAPTSLGPAQFDAAVLAASLHMHRYQNSIIDFAREHHARLNRMPSLFISVSLSAAGRDPDDLRGIAECAENFQAETGWRPKQILQVAGAFRFTRYGFFKSLAMRRIAKAKNVTVNPHEDLELTDWHKFAHDLKAFRAQLEGRGEPVPGKA